MDELGRSRFAFLDTQHTSVIALKNLINACVDDAEQSSNPPDMKAFFNNYNHRDVGYPFLTDFANGLFRFRNALIVFSMIRIQIMRIHFILESLMIHSYTNQAHGDSASRWANVSSEPTPLHATPSRGPELFTATWKTVGNFQVSLRVTVGELYLCISFHKPHTVKGNHVVVP